jgi:branched-chain amino acid aminotransferase
MEIKFIRREVLKEKPSQGSLGFGKHFTDYMFVMDYEEGKGWHNAAIQPYAAIELDPALMVLHYGQAVFEGLKCDKGEDGRLRLFRPLDNFRRLNVSDERLCIPYIDENFALNALKELILRDADWVPDADGTSLYIRPFVFATEVCVGVHPSSKYKFMIILSPVGAYYPEGFNPVRIYVEDEYVRAVRGGIGYTKGAANYAISLKSQEKAQRLGYSQVLWLDGVDRKFVEEVGSMNVFFVINNKLVTPSLEGSILPGITRDSVIRLATRQGMTVEERKISIIELYEAHEKGTLTEAFGSGTAAVISPIGELNWDNRPIVIGDGKTGPVARSMYETLTGIQYGRVEDFMGWTQTF